MGGGASKPQNSVAAAMDHVRSGHAAEFGGRVSSNDEINAKLAEKEGQKKAAAAAEDYERCSALRDEIAALREQQQSQHMRGDQLVFLVQAPKIPNCEAVAFIGDLYKLGHGRGHGITLSAATDALTFVLDGPVENCAVRLADDPGLALEINCGKMSPGTTLSVWENKKDGKVMKAWSCKFSYNADRTLSPAKHPELAVGVEKAANPWQLLQLVKRGDAARQLVFEGSEVIDERWAGMERERAAAAFAAAIHVKLARAVCADPNFRRELKANGFYHIAGGAAPELVRRAIQEINRQVGSSGQAVDAFKAKTFPSHPAITGLFNNSMIPHILQKLLGGPSPYRIGSGQLALRFPGDACPRDKCECSAAQFEACRKSWHIDGCPNNFIPGLTDHFGEVHNFDALCGILLSDVPEPMAGELCAYPGSHYHLAEYFKKHGFDGVAKKGTLPNGEQTDKIFGGTKPKHCTGKAGDVFIANYMTAHFIAPNTAPHIRYAVYFRVTGRGYDRKNWKASMLDPWKDWPGLSEGAIAETSEAGHNRRFRAVVDSLEVALETQRRIDHHATVDNFHVVQKAHMEGVHDDERAE